MLNLPTVQESLGSYIDAGFPILYIQTYEETNADRYIAAAAGRIKIVEWNGANGFVDFKTKAPITPNTSLEDALTKWIQGGVYNRHLFVIKDADKLLESDKVIALLKELARKIRKEDGALIPPSLSYPRFCVFPSSSKS